MKFKISIEAPNGTELISCEVKDCLYHKLLERIGSREHIKDKPHFDDLAEKYRGEIEMILLPPNI